MDDYQMKNFPKKFNLNVYGSKVSVKVVKDIQGGFLGLYYAPNKEILINDNQPIDEKIDTLVHEVIHAIFHRAGLNQTGIDSQLEEVIAQQTATVITENFNLTLKKRK